MPVPQFFFANYVVFCLQGNLMIKVQLFDFEFKLEHSFLQVVDLFFLLIELVQSILPIFLAWENFYGLIYCLEALQIILLRCILLGCLLQSIYNLIVLLLSHLRLLLLLLNLLGQELHFLAQDGLLLGLLVAAIGQLG